MIAEVVVWSIRHRVLVVSMTIGLAIAATWVGLRVKLDALPDITNNQVLVLTRAPGLTPEEIERRVTRPIETVLGGLPGMLEQRSLSRYGISSVTVVFDDEVEPYRARQLVQERLNTLSDLPAGVDKPELGPLSGGLGEIFHITLAARDRTAAELFELAQYRVAPLLRSVPGVVEVNTWGGQRRTFEVLADPIRLAQRKVTLAELRSALQVATGTVPGAFLLSTGGTQTLLRGVALPGRPADLGMILVRRGDDGQPVRLADLATISEGALPRIGAATENGRGETVYLMAQMLRGENALDVTGAINARMPAVRAALPPDVRIDLVYDRSILVGRTLATVGKNLLEGGLLVIVVLFAMLGSLRAGLLVALAIPLSMVGASVGMVAFGVAGTLMSLGAIDFGLVVDGSVVVVEQIFHSLRGAHANADVRARIRDAASQVAQPMFFSVLIILLVYVPVLTLSGVDGKMFRPMALTVVFALATSLVLALTFIPAAASLVLRLRDVPARDPLLVRAVERGYRPLLALASHRPIVVAAIGGALLAIGIVLFVRAGTEFAPQLDEGDLVLQTQRASDLSLDGAVTKASQTETLLRGFPEVAQVVSRIGSPAIATDIMGIEQSDVFIRLHPSEKWRRGLVRDRLIAEMQQAIERLLPGGEPSFTQPIQMRFNELLGGAVTDVTIAVFGDDLSTLRRLATTIDAEVQKEPGAVDVRVLAPPDVALIDVVPRPLEASQRGFSVGDVLEAVQALQNGVEVGVTYDGPVRIPIRLRLDADRAANALPRLPLPSSAGGVVPLSTVADVRQVAAPSLVNHENGARRLLVGFNVRGADLGQVVERAQARVAAKVVLPHGYRLVWGGQYETLQAASRRLRVVIPVVVVLIFAVLLLAFRQLRPALVIFTNVPFACVGGIVALALRQMPVSISAAVGFIALSGVAVLNGVVLVSRILYEEQRGVSPAEAAVQAARARVRPVLMTALVAALGFVPMMLAHGVGAEVQRPLATVVVGGLVTSTFLTLVILPATYPWFARRRRTAPPAASTTAPPAAPAE